MLWPIVFPFQITVCLFALVIIIATLAAPLARLKRLPTFFAMMLLGVVGFIPSCSGIMEVIDAKRFGVFSYASFEDVNDFRVERYLPPDAKQIIIDKYPQGFRARFKISREQLDAYLDELWDTYGEYSAVKRGGVLSMNRIDLESHNLRFGDLGWPHLPDATEYYSPRAANGAGFSVWYSPAEGVAYERAGYW